MPLKQNELERADLQNDVPSSITSLHDLRELYYKGELGLSGTADRQESELIRQFLINKTGAVGVRSIRDLWVLYLTQVEGIAYRPSLGDMMKEFFNGGGKETGGGNPPISSGSSNAGLFFGLPYGLTYAS